MRRAALVPLLLVSVAAGGCARLADIGSAPSLSEISNPALQPEARVISMPMPQPVPTEQIPSSLWRTGSRNFFGDPRAKSVGDLLTVIIDISDQAQMRNSTQRGRANSEKAGLPNFFGLESRLPAVLPDAVDPSSLVDLDSTSTSSGNGTIQRTERIAMRVAAVVTQVLPNGNFVIAGRQEVRVNYELREMRIAGVLRPEDISNVNTIDYDKIAEARITYGGRGQITDVQQPRYGQQVLDVILPF
ncbi:flagellar basal body L-ring protein FlgH [Azospirillum agricola]|uniref:flagellar basal body L-ring protein FlgH n=1 Tax=Azospirillum agricola TaxID=1720247 RepID=UPI000A0F3D56|nr:flagellar basal body L-ring protein FlgH [Azospirillum agricola]MBP2231140.1 flagellar L-ring protein precursor FlgH [Azospirillum agricola]SMH63049.1 flagellar L-ring protein precursor FlgH [Azospirillum lipoferum]